MLTKITGTKATKEINNYHYSPGLFEILEISQPEHCRQNVRNYRNKFTQTKEYSIETIMLDVNLAGKDRVELNQSCETIASFAAVIVVRWTNLAKQLQHLAYFQQGALPDS